MTSLEMTIHVQKAAGLVTDRIRMGLQRSTLNVQLSTFKSPSDASVIWALSFALTFLLAKLCGTH
jgi:hypothetical protein